jgi:hypothetical protein
MEDACRVQFVVSKSEIAIELEQSDEQSMACKALCSMHSSLDDASPFPLKSRKRK